MTYLFHSSAGTNRRGFTWIELLVVLVIIFVIIALLFPLISDSRDVARRIQCSNNLRQIGIAISNYHDTYKTLPSAQILDADGKALHSWRIQLLPYTYRQHLYEQLRFDEPWDSEHNISLELERGYGFHCPNADAYRRDKARINEKTCQRMADYQVVVGPKTPFERDRYTDFDAFERGVSNTYLLTEMTTAVPWFAPVDLPVELLNCGVVPSLSGIRSVGSQHAGGVNVVFADGCASFISNSKSPQDIEHLKTMFLLAEPKSSETEEVVASLQDAVNF